MQEGENEKRRGEGGRLTSVRREEKKTLQQGSPPSGVRARACVCVHVCVHALLWLDSVRSSLGLQHS